MIYDSEFQAQGPGVLFYFREKSGIQAKHASRSRLILGRLHASISHVNMDFPGLYLYQLTGDRKEIWSVRVLVVTGVSHSNSEVCMRKLSITTIITEAISC